MQRASSLPGRSQVVSVKWRRGVGTRQLVQSGRVSLSVRMELSIVNYGMSISGSSTVVPASSWVQSERNLMKPSVMKQ